MPGSLRIRRNSAAALAWRLLAALALPVIAHAATAPGP